MVAASSLTYCILAETGTFGGPPPRLPEVSTAPIPLLPIAEISWEIVLEPSMCSSARTKLTDARNAVFDSLEEVLLNPLHTGTEIL